MEINFELLRKLRLKRGWTQLHLAQRIGIDERTYRRYESPAVNDDANLPGRRATRMVTLRYIAQVHELADFNQLLIQPLVPEVASKPPGTEYDAACYVHHRDEKIAHKLLAVAGAPLALQGPWRFGKRTLLSYLVENYTSGPDGAKVMRIDLAALPTEAFASLDHLLLTIAIELLEQNGCTDASARAHKLWEGAGSAKGRLARLFREDLLTADAPLLLAIEKVERLEGCTYHHDFFAMLRAWCESKHDEPWKRFRLIVTVATEPTLLERNDSSSFFAMTTRIVLEAFKKEQIAEMALWYRQNPAASVIEEMMQRIGGHPYLWRLILHQAEIRGLELSELISQQALCTEIFEPHLRGLSEWAREQRLLAAICSVLSTQDGPLDLTTYAKLYRQGLVIEDQPHGRHRMRCRLYADHFGALCHRR